MALIEGVGDEVVHFFIFLFLVFVAFLAWFSTHISDRPLIRTVVILERRATRRPIEGSTGSPLEIEPGEADEPPVETEAEKTVNTNAEAEGREQGLLDGEEEEIMSNAEDFNSRMADLDLLTEPDAPNLERIIVSHADDSAMLRNRRLAFFQNRRGEVQSQNESLKELIGQQTEETVQEEETPSQDEPTTEGSIRIRLKYLNDEQKMVEGRLWEQLGEFKRRHFSIELAGRKLVRLIFNGQVLQQENKTLKNYGLFDNCVVHCLVHQPRTPPPSPSLNRASRTGDVQGADSNPPPSWDLGNILFASLSMLLGLAWYGRYQYAQLYTATTTVALVGLTSIFMVSLIAMYMPELDGQRT